MNTGSLIKSGGIIYGSNASPTTLKNTASNDSLGHAVSVSNGGKKRNTTAGESVNLDSSTAENWE
ncbi:MAG: hypothetical protein Ta2B_10950 [Termitinemataceae bacterium]|nr:MAG: hypothetical protein Ta2B_10950 [Termitinemataceae bacterium]